MYHFIVAPSTFLTFVSQIKCDKVNKMKRVFAFNETQILLLDGLLKLRNSGAQIILVNKTTNKESKNA